jgi:hypothetical protein
VKFSPASSETTLAPLAPPAATRVGEANAAVKTGSVDGVTNVAVAPASGVRTSTSPFWVAITHSAVETQLTAVRLAAVPSALGAHVAPPSSVRRNRPPSPTA